MAKTVPPGDWQPTNLMSFKAIAGLVIALVAVAGIWLPWIAWVWVAALVLCVWDAPWRPWRAWVWLAARVVGVWAVCVAIGSPFRLRGLSLAILGILVSVGATLVDRTGMADRYLLPAPTAEDLVAQQLAMLAQRIDRWEAEQEQLSVALLRLTEDKALVVLRLRELGVESTADLAATPQARPLAEELVELEEQTRALENRRAQRETALERIRSGRRRIERREALADFHEDEIVALWQTAAEVENELTTAEPQPPVELKIEQVLEEALKEEAAPSEQP